MRHGLLQVTGSNVVSVAESEVMRMLILIRNFLPGWQQVNTLLVGSPSDPERFLVAPQPLSMMGSVVEKCLACC